MRDKEKLFKLLRECAETPQESFAVEEMISKIEGKLPTVEVIDEKHQKFNGLVFSSSNALRSAGRYFKLISLHRFVWTCYNGEIPEGYDIHHKDFDKDNNDISNLEALPESVHQSLHARQNGLKSRKNRGKFICINCGCEYEADDNGHNLYCSKNCLEEYKKNVLYVESRICEHCGKEFSAYKYGHQKFCSHECSVEHVKQNSGTEKRACAVCGKEIIVVKHESDRHKYCSVECQRTASRNQVVKKCLICGKEYSIKASKAPRSKYCSRECFNASKRKS